MIVKIHDSENGTVVAVCDSDLIGKKFEDSGLQLDLTSNFYKGEEKTDGEVGDLLRNAYCVNIVGEKSVNLAVKEGIISDSSIKKISGVPYIQGNVK